MSACLFAKHYLNLLPKIFLTAPSSSAIAFSATADRGLGFNRRTMLQEKQQQARNLYFQTDLNKTQIADLLNIGRRTLHYWIRENNWDRLKKSASLLPSMLAENCYLVLNNFTESLLSERRIVTPINSAEAEIVHKLACTIKKLKSHSTINESMEMFGHFVDRVNQQAPELADQLMPFLNQYMEDRARVLPPDLYPRGIGANGLRSEYDREQQAKIDKVERQHDYADHFAWQQEVNPTMINLELWQQQEAEKIAAEEAERRQPYQEFLNSANPDEPFPLLAIPQEPVGDYEQAAMETEHTASVHEPGQPTSMLNEVAASGGSVSTLTREAIAYRLACEKIPYPEPLPEPRTVGQRFIHDAISDKRRQQHARQFHAEN